MSRADLPPEPPSSEITPEPLYRKSRREFLVNAALFAVGAGAIGSGLTLLTGKPRPAPKKTTEIALADGLAKAPGSVTTATTLATSTESSASTETSTDPATTNTTKDGAWKITKKIELADGEEQTPYEKATTYNNYYEFGTGKGDPAEHATEFRTRPWTVTIEGEVAKPQTIDIDTLIKWAPLEERVYRMRCVEAWSMVVPWVGFPLAAVLKRVEPTSKAKFVAFRSVVDPEQMPGQKRRVLQWPYSEGLRLDEAMHPLTLLAVGMYGRVLPNQNGAPLRLVVPWKYGFKGAKAIVKIRLMEQQPLTTWSSMAPEEYGFYANVNPQVDHPRWSQATEHRVGEWQRRPTLPFNGYGEQVASLYKGLDLREHF